MTATKKQIDALISKVNKEHGDGSAMRMGSSDFNIKTIPSGIMELDRALGGGWPTGRIMEIFGPESSGKTTVALYMIAAAQARGEVCAFIDLENALDPAYATNVVGVNIDELLISQPTSAEEALDIIGDFVESGLISLVVVDSVAALTPAAEIAGDVGDSHMGLVARLMSQSLRKINNLHITSSSDTTVLFINQLREKIGVMFGNPETTTGGRALKFYSSVRIETRSPPSKAIKNGDEHIGREIRANVVKNKCAPPFRVAIFDLMYDTGVDPDKGLFTVGLAEGLIGQRGAWFYDVETDENIGQGKSAAVQYLRDNPAIADEYRERIFTGTPTPNQGRQYE